MRSAHGNLGGALADLGEMDEALAACETAVRIKPDLPRVFNNLVYFGLLHPGFDAARNLELAKRWAERFEEPLLVEIRPHGTIDRRGGDCALVMFRRIFANNRSVGFSCS